MKTEKVTIQAEMEGRWVPHFLGMLKAMEHYGAIGASRNVTIYADGDGDFRPKFTFDPAHELAKPVADDDGALFFDAG